MQFLVNSPRLRRAVQAVCGEGSIEFTAPICRALNARAVGDSDDILILAHGFGSDQSVWRDYMPWLSQRYRVVAYDLACAGTASPEFFTLPRHESLDGHVDDLIHLLRALSVGRCTFVGHSVSGMLGVLAARRVPEIFEKLILIGASACYLSDTHYMGGFDYDAIGAILNAIRLNYRDWAKSFGPFAVDKAPGDPAAESFVASLLRMRPDVAVAMAKAIFLSDYRAVLPSCTAPTTILQTRHDPAVPLQAAQYLGEHIPASTLEIIDATGHLPHLSAPATMAAALRRHLPKFGANGSVGSTA
ncbi:MAG TPA: alpha/beta hydrolase [Alphaproteobacteria bacterium]|nr:alpha/beta hydrolase [Alphaproteobacteria bacterium]